MANEGEDKLSFNFSKLRSKLKRDKSSGDEMALDLSKVSNWFKSHQAFVAYALLAVLLIFSGVMRFQSEARFTGVYADGLSDIDSYWHYRHAKNVYDHGYVGEEKRCYNGGATDTALPYDGKSCPAGYKATAWDTLHDAPHGSPTTPELYSYVAAYSYKFIGKFFTSSFVAWFRWTPAIFAVLAIFFMFLLVKQLFGPSAGIAAAFLYSLAPALISKSMSGAADNDALVQLLIVFTFYFFTKAWDTGSIVYAIFGGVALGIFGVGWNGYTFAPILMIATAGFFLVYKVGVKFLTNQGELVSLVKGHFKENWKKYAGLAIILVLGITIVGSVIGTSHMNIFSAITSSTGLKATEVLTNSPEGEEVRNVYMTVAEMNPANLRDTIARIHVSVFLMMLAFVALLPFGLWKKIENNVHHFGFYILWIAASIYMSLKAMRFIGILTIPVCILAGISVAFVLSKINTKRPILSVIIVLAIFLSIFAVPNISVETGGQGGPSLYTTATAVMKQVDPSFSPNWYDFMKWARTETPKDAIYASWWDPGHFITSIGQRPVVADGSQNSNHVHDLAIAFTTNNESVALERLKKYNVTYFFTSSDLLSKYGAISFLAKGQGESYYFLSMSEVKNTASGTVAIYPLSQDVSILVNMKDEGISAVLKQGYQSQPIRRVMYNYNESTYVMESIAQNAIDGMLYLDPSYRSGLFMPVNIEKNMLTQLHLFDAKYLKHFELVHNYGNEIKVFKVNYD